MLINPQELNQNLDRLEEIEKVSLRLVTQAIYFIPLISFAQTFLLERKVWLLSLMVIAWLSKNVYLVIRVWWLLSLMGMRYGTMLKN